MYETRNYHYDPSQIDAYKKWAIELAIPFFKTNLEVVGFWIDNVEPPELSGEAPMQLPLGSATVTWIIKWESMAARNQFRQHVLTGEKLQKDLEQPPRLERLHTNRVSIY